MTALPVYRPTILRLAEEHCPAAVNYYEDLRAQFREIFGTGIAAHAVLEHLGVLAIQKGAQLTEAEIWAGADVMGQALLAKGRTFDGVQEPPLPAGQIIGGRRLAVRWALDHPLSHTARYEMGVGFTRDWKLCGYDVPEARFHLILDTLDTYTDADEENELVGMEAADYKSSWQAGAEDLESIQMKAQSVAAWKTAPMFKVDPAFIRRTIINLRTQQSVSATLWLDEDGVKTLERWQREITAHCDALDAMPKQRPARPGYGCMGCPWVMSCQPAEQFLGEALAAVVHGAETDRVELAKAYCIATAHRERLFSLVKRATKEEPIDIGGGVLVGYVAKQSREPKPDAGKQAWRIWEQRGGDGDGFALAMQPGIESLESVAKRLHPRKPKEWRPLLDEWLDHPSKPEFGVHADAPANQMPGYVLPDASTEVA